MKDTVSIELTEVEVEYLYNMTVDDIDSFSHTAESGRQRSRFTEHGLNQLSSKLNPENFEFKDES